MQSHSKRLTYRPFNQQDFDALFDIFGDPDTVKYLPGEARTEDQVQRTLDHFILTFDDDKKNHYFAICLDEFVIGYGGLGYVKEFDEVEIMYGFNKNYWGKGFATEASLHFKELAKELGIEFVIALADIHNIPSQKVLLKTGFKKQKQMPLWGLEVYYYEMKIKDS